MVIDASAPFSVKVLGAPHAFIDAIRQLDPATSQWYSIYPEGEQGYCHAGQTCTINLRLRNNGDAAGNIYIKVTRLDNNAVIFNQSYNLNVGAYVDISNPAPTFTMPNADISLQFEIGH